MNKNHKVSAVVPTYNSWETLKDCIVSLQKQTLKFVEIIIVDNASTDGTVKQIQNYKSKLKIFRNKSNLGVTGGRNRGIKEASKNSDYLFFFDHDMVAEPTMLSELVKVAQSRPEIGIVTPKIFYWDNKKVIWSAGTDVNLWTGQTIFHGGKDRAQYEEVREVAVAPAALLVKKEVISKIKKFDERYFLTYEDTDFCFRAREKGFLTYYAPKAFAYHKIPYDERYATLRLLDRTYWVGRNRVIFMKRFSKNFLVFVLFLPIYFLYYLFTSLKYGRVTPVFNFVRGTFGGFFA